MNIIDTQVSDIAMYLISLIERGKFQWDKVYILQRQLPILQIVQMDCWYWIEVSVLVIILKQADYDKSWFKHVTPVMEAAAYTLSMPMVFYF